MKATNFGELRAVVTGGTDGHGGGNGPVVVLLHGFGAPADDLVSLGRVFDAPEGTRFIFPEGSLVLGGNYGDGRAWWEIQIERFVYAMERGRLEEFIQEQPNGLSEANARVVGFLDDVERRLGVSGRSIVLGGFSQGAMLACDIALRTIRPFAGLMLLSSTILTEAEWFALIPKRKDLRVFLSHGDTDPILPFMLAERLHRQFVQGGIDVTWCPFRGGHGIPEEVVTGACAFLKQVIGP